MLREQAAIALQIVLQGETPRLLDEWQHVPSIWNVIQAEIDGRVAKGQFILTGSASPSDGTWYSRVYFQRKRSMVRNADIPKVKKKSFYFVLRSACSNFATKKEDEK